VSPTLNLEDAVAVAALIDHTLLTPKATSSEIERLCSEAVEFRFASVCINPYWVRRAAARLGDSGVKVCTVIGFPLGANIAEVKEFEARSALADGARELDMVLNVGALLSGEPVIVADEIARLAKLAHAGSALLKVILETCLLDDRQKVEACRLAVDAGADFVKTSTGFSVSGATASDVALMRQTVGARAGVKASGGVRTLETLREMVAAGATRIGTSSGVKIIEQLAQAGGTGNEHARDTASAGY
jgi:deoxyribose-phosphate aldolase